MPGTSGPCPSSTRSVRTPARRSSASCCPALQAAFLPRPSRYRSLPTRRLSRGQLWLPLRAHRSSCRTPKEGCRARAVLRHWVRSPPAYRPTRHLGVGPCTAGRSGSGCRPTSAARRAVHPSRPPGRGGQACSGRARPNAGCTGSGVLQRLRGRPCKGPDRRRGHSVEGVPSPTQRSPLHQPRWRLLRSRTGICAAFLRGYRN